ncbi:MAG: cyclopropane-fatty-acyl-phospholipid synthase family protein [Pseudomonadota bacterium]
MPPERTAASATQPRWFEAFLTVVNRIDTGSLEIVLPDGRVFEARGSHDGPSGRIEVHTPEFFSRMARDGELGFGEMYMDGWWSSPDLQAVLDVCLLNNENMSRRFPGQGLVRAYERLRHWLRSNTRAGSKRNIAYHYDLGNSFYAHWLDPSMTYSSALFTGTETLAEAQTNKYAAICDRLALTPDARLLEIGCGWGGFAEYAIRERGARITGLTLSREQKDYAERRLFEAGLAERAEIVLRDYRDERGRYDAIASIEMFEAVGERYWPTYFDTLHQRLRPGGTAALQVITIADELFAGYRRSTDFVQKYIFPGGMLPSSEALTRQIARAGLDLSDTTAFGPDYSRTLREWRESFNAQWREISDLGFDDRFHRMWNFYLTCCAACFAAGTTDVVQVGLRRPG